MNLGRRGFLVDRSERRQFLSRRPQRVCERFRGWHQLGSARNLDALFDSGRRSSISDRTGVSAALTDCAND
jgi:hypothetical protein